MGSWPAHPIDLAGWSIEGPPGGQNFYGFHTLTRPHDFKNGHPVSSGRTLSLTKSLKSGSAIRQRFMTPGEKDPVVIGQADGKKIDKIDWAREDRYRDLSEYGAFLLKRVFLAILPSRTQSILSIFWLYLLQRLFKLMLPP